MSGLSRDGAWHTRPWAIGQSSIMRGLRSRPGGRGPCLCVLTYIMVQGEDSFLSALRGTA